MAAKTSTVTRTHPAGVSVRALGSVARDAGAGIAGWWSRLAATGQLGPDRERELGRHTGARI
jgi:hypothetical protein